MFYLAIALISAGLLLLFYIFISVSSSDSDGMTVSQENQPVRKEPVPDPQISAPLHKKEFSERSTPRPPERPSMRFQWVDTGKAPPPAVPSEEQLIAEGVLFLDHGRQIHLSAGRFERLDAEAFLNLKRVGHADFKAIPSGFTIHCGQASYRFSSESLEQILFLNGGIALVPSNRSEAVVVFLTESVDRIREFIKKYSRIPAKL